MEKVVIRVLIVFGILAVLYTALPVKAGESKLPLQHGLYLREGVKYPGTEKRSFPPESFSFNDEGLSYPGCRCFEILQIRKQGSVYYLTQRCVLKGEDILKTNLAIIIKNQTSFLLIDHKAEQKETEKREILYHYYENPNNR